MASKVGVAVLGIGKEVAPRVQRLLASSDRLRVKWLVDRDVASAQKLVDNIPGSSDAKTQIAKPWQWDSVCKDKGYVNSTVKYKCCSLR